MEIINVGNKGKAHVSEELAKRLIESGEWKAVQAPPKPRTTRRRVRKEE